MSTASTWPAPGTPETLVDLVVPALQTRGASKTACRAGTRRETPFAGTGPHPKASLPGAAYRVPERSAAICRRMMVSMRWAEVPGGKKPR